VSSPAEHYAEAERLLELAGVDSDMRQTRIRLAQVHATLATVDPQMIGRMRPPIVVMPGEM
jgi:hypothetical protein